MTARAYQLEMLEESLKQNIIVAVCCPTPKMETGHFANMLPKMDTGSGKTQV